jgi:hypothetical protein
MRAKHNFPSSAPNTPRISTYRPSRPQRFYNQHFQHPTELLIPHVLISLRINTYKNFQIPRNPLITLNLNSTKINTSGAKDLKSPRINSSANKDLKSPIINTSKKQGRGVGPVGFHRILSRPTHPEPAANPHWLSGIPQRRCTEAQPVGGILRGPIPARKVHVGRSPERLLGARYAHGLA